MLDLEEEAGEEQEYDDPQEVFMEGSDEEFGDLSDTDNGTNTEKNLVISYEWCCSIQ